MTLPPYRLVDDASSLALRCRLGEEGSIPLLSLSAPRADITLRRYSGFQSGCTSAISMLKDEQRRKIVLTFNDEELGNKAETYGKYREKIVNVELLFARTTEEAADLAFPCNAPRHAHVREKSLKIGITNIRVLRKIDRLCAMTFEEVKDLHTKVITETITTIVLLAWSYYESGETKPNLAYSVFDAKRTLGITAPRRPLMAWARIWSVRRADSSYASGLRHYCYRVSLPYGATWQAVRCSVVQAG